MERRFGGTYHLHLQGRKPPEQETSVQQAATLFTALISVQSGGRSVGILRLRTKGHGVCFCIYSDTCLRLSGSLSLTSYLLLFFYLRGWSGNHFTIKTNSVALSQRANYTD
jgi:hypothetical protein